MTINGQDVSAASSVEELVTNINRDTFGISAVLNDNGTITLSNDTGNNIVIGDGEEAGFSVTTYTGYLALTSLDGEEITVVAKQEKNGYAGGLERSLIFSVRPERADLCWRHGWWPGQTLMRSRSPTTCA